MRRYWPYNAHMSACIYACVCRCNRSLIHIHVCVHACMHACVYIQTIYFIYMCVFMHACVCIRIIWMLWTILKLIFQEDNYLYVDMYVNICMSIRAFYLSVGGTRSHVCRHVCKYMYMYTCLIFQEENHLYVEMYVNICMSIHAFYLSVGGTRSHVCRHVCEYMYMYTCLLFTYKCKILIFHRKVLDHMYVEMYVNICICIRALCSHINSGQLAWDHATVIFIYNSYMHKHIPSTNR
jgi:hypothetical protein